MPPQGTGRLSQWSGRLVAIDLPCSIALIVLTIVGGTMVLVPQSCFDVCRACNCRARKFRRFWICVLARQSEVRLHRRSFSRIHTVKGMAMEPQMQRRFERLQQAVAETTMASILTGSQPNLGNALWQYLATHCGRDRGFK